jgi:hypothetical protein
LAVQTVLGGFVPVEAAAGAQRKQLWPGTLTEQVRAIKSALRAAPLQTPQQIAAGFRPARRRRVEEILETLTALGQTRQVEDRYLRRRELGAASPAGFVPSLRGGFVLVGHVPMASPWAIFDASRWEARRTLLVDGGCGQQQKANANADPEEQMQVLRLR